MPEAENLIKNTLIRMGQMIYRLFGPRSLLYFPGRLRSVIRILADEGDTVVLGGVYVPKTIRNWLDVLGESGKLIAIEANPSSVKSLGLEFQGISNLKLVSKAIWDGPGKITFTASATDYQGWGRVKDDAISSYPSQFDDTAYDIEVEADSIDNIVSELDIHKVDVVYLTINDAQIKAIDGLGDVMKNNKNIRIMMHSRTPYPAKECVEKLRSLGMRASTKTLTRQLKRPDEKQIVTIYACH